MDARIENKLTLLAENAALLKTAFPHEEPPTWRLSALLCALMDRQADVESIRECMEMIRANISHFPTSEGCVSLGISTMLSLVGDRERVFTGTLQAYDMLRGEKLKHSVFLAFAAFKIAADTTENQYAAAVRRTRVFYDAMKASHRFITGEDDYIFAAMLALSGMDVQESASRMESLFQQLRNEFSDKNSLQALTQVLALAGMGEEAAERLLALRGLLRQQKIRLDKSYTLSSLGVLTLIPRGEPVIAQAVIEARQFLRARKGFGKSTVEEEELLLLVAAAVASGMTADAPGLIAAAAVSSISSLILAAEAAMIAAMHVTV